MAIIIKTKEEIEILREGGKRLAMVLAETAKLVKPGISALELDKFAEAKIKELGDDSAFLGYRPKGHRMAFPASLCISVNSEIVHGIPKSTTILKEGDIVSLDLGIKHKGLFTDHAITVPVGHVSKDKEKLMRDTREAMYVGINAIVPGARVGDVGYAIESHIKKSGNYGIVRVLAGHGVGRAIHEDPFIPNFGRPKSGEKFVPGMVIAIEPMLNLGGDDVIDTDDGYTIKTADGSASAHFEHTVYINDQGLPEILTEV